MNNKVEINYLKKDFNTVREELINYLKTLFLLKEKFLQMKI